MFLVSLLLLSSCPSVLSPGLSGATCNMGQTRELRHPCSLFRDLLQQQPKFLSQFRLYRVCLDLGEVGRSGLELWRAGLVRYGDTPFCQEDISCMTSRP